MQENIGKFDFDKTISHWLVTSEEDFNTMMTLYKSRSYAWALFLGHISTEKLLKALYVKKLKKHAPFTHNLYRLAELIEINIPEDYADWLDEITTFNINARYDDYKREFYQQCTADYTKEWINRIKLIRAWIKTML